MGYWSNQPMTGDFPEDVQDEIRDRLLSVLNAELLNKIQGYRDGLDLKVGVAYSLDDFNIDEYEQNRQEFEKWIQEQSKTNEKVILKEINDIVTLAHEDKGFGCRRADVNSISFILPLSFLDWEVKLDSQSELSQYLLTLLKDTDGGSKQREYPKRENAYPKGINTPSDFVKSYIDNWNQLISGEMSLKEIKSTSNIKSMKFGHLLNTR